MLYFNFNFERIFLNPPKPFSNFKIPHQNDMFWCIVYFSGLRFFLLNKQIKRSYFSKNVDRLVIRYITYFLLSPNNN